VGRGRLAPRGSACDDTEFVTLGDRDRGVTVLTVLSVERDLNKEFLFLFPMSVVVHRTVVPCERTALVSSPHTW